MSNISYETLINNPYPIDPFNELDPNYDQYKKIFEDLQGGIIKSYARNFSTYIFVQFDGNKIDQVKQWIQSEIANGVTSTWMQLKVTEAYKNTKERMRRQGLDPSIYIGEPQKNFFLSAQGYRTLGYNLENPNEIVDSSFKSGVGKDWERSYRLENPQNDYWYNPPKDWDIGWDQNKAKSNVDALIFLVHDGLEELKNEVAIIISQCEKIGKVVACEAGYRLRDPNGKHIGAFGFADGISQPLFLTNDYNKYLASQNMEQENALAWDPKASLSLVLVKDPFTDKPYSFGSYCVLQKLETNYDLFKRKVECLADQFEFGRDRERASALVIGRFKDGTPLDLSDKPYQSMEVVNVNNFKYDNDPGGGKCPLQAHIRKVNPRNELTASPANRNKNRIFRAGITYFDAPTVQQSLDLNMLQQCSNKLDYLNNVVRKQSLAENIESISGLLFVSFQRSISAQFSKLQQEWADKRDFPDITDKGKRYLDPIIGHPATSSFQDHPIQQEWPKEWGNKNDSFYYSFYGCVKHRGGEFFFVPSISFLKTISRSSTKSGD